MGLIHYAHYLHLLDEAHKTFVAEVQADSDLNADQKKQILDQGSSAAINLFLVSKTGHEGFVGSMFLRAEQGYTHQEHADFRNWGTWILWSLEALAVVWVAASMARTRASATFCEDCGHWCAKSAMPITVAGESAPELAEAVRDDDLHRAAQVLAAPIDPATLADHSTGAALHECPGCDQVFADVITVQVRRKGKKVETVTRTILNRVRISPTMASLFHATAAGPAADSPPGDEGQSEAESAGEAEAVGSAHGPEPRRPARTAGPVIGEAGWSGSKHPGGDLGEGDREAHDVGLGAERTGADAESAVGEGADGLVGVGGAVEARGGGRCRTCCRGSPRVPAE